MLIELVTHIDLAKAYAALQAPEAGGINLFVGTVRNHAHGREVVRLVFEAYEAMALSEMQEIGRQAAAQWPLSGLVIQHVLGERRVGEAVVVVGVASAHRDASYEACRFLIDTLKATVPIWKKEYYTDHSVWVNAHP